MTIACNLGRMALLVGLIGAPSLALAHAQLRQAEPPVGGTVSGSPGEIQLHFSEGVEPSFSGIALSAEGGASIPTGRAALGPDASTLVVKVEGALAPGNYRVEWHAVSVDTHKTQGSCTFTVR